MKSTYSILLAASFSLLVACSKKEDAQPMAPTTTNLSATINGAQQVPANNSTATGTFTGTYNGTSKQLSYTVVYQGFTPSAAHIHFGTPGNSGAVAIPFSSLTSPITGTVLLNDADATKLLNNGMYVNMHSSTFTNGEIRGDIRK